MTRGWRGRILASTLLFIVLYAALSIFSFEPDFGGLFLLSAVVAASVWLIVDALVDLRPSWTVTADSATSSLQLDTRLATYIRIVEHHLKGTNPDATLRDRLATLADARLLERHGLRRGDAAGRDLLGPELLSVIEGSVRRLTVAELDRHVRRLEEL